MDPNTPAPASQPEQPTQPVVPTEPQQMPEPVPQPSEPQQFAPAPPVSPAPIDPYLPPQPQVTEQPMGNVAAPLKDPGHGLGIASLVTSLLGLSVVGIILGILALKKSRKAGFPTNVLGLIGLILGAITTVILVPLVVLTLSNFQGAQAKARDTMAISNLHSLHSKLEEYHNTYVAYPKMVSTANLVGIDPAALTDPTGSPLIIEDGTDLNISEALETDLPTASARYQYIPFDCGETYCMGYVLRTYIEKPTSVTKNPYVKLGLNNP